VVLNTKEAEATVGACSKCNLTILAIKMDQYI